jgi:hypothetical protein
MTDRVFESYHDMLMPFIKSAPIKTVNATGGGALHGAPIISMDLEKAIRKYCA